ncbi:MAG: N-acetylmuramoyl-L-alanine amidase [Hespellia sp.]|nr:N-acetylmuramoyl-L-alanine amidase [Hespellia sp.]
MKKEKKKKLKILMAMILFAVIIALVQWLRGQILELEVSGNRVTENAAGQNIVIIDPGHGGSDSGKVGVNQVLEKDINLVIAQRLKQLLEQQKVEVQMTRESGESIADSKMEDMCARVDMINRSEANLAVSIHQNSYTAESVHGAQVFYHTSSKEGKEAALILQEALKQLDPGNTRQAKADSSYYMLRKTERPVVIVECGFLSNWEEAEKLETEEYQIKIAEAVCSGIITYLNKQML